MELLHSGKVRDVYADGADILLVASDRVSIYDVVLPTAVPDRPRSQERSAGWAFDTDRRAVGRVTWEEYLLRPAEEPTGADATVMYRVLYEWDERTCRHSTSRN